jgi:hypothetical protein
MFSKNVINGLLLEEKFANNKKVMFYAALFKVI